MRSLLVSSYSIDELIEEIDSKIKRGFNPSLAFIYIAITYNISRLVEEVEKYPFLILGSTTVGEFYADKNSGVNDNEDSITCMLIEVNPQAIALKHLSLNGRAYYKTGQEIGEWAKEQFSDPTIVTLTSGLSFDSDDYVQGIFSCGISSVYGGVAGDDYRFKYTFVFSKENYTNHGIVALALDNSKIEAIGSCACGWMGIGKKDIVTKSYKNILHEIDNRPAVEFYKKYLQTTIDMPQTGREYPLQVITKNQTIYRVVTHINRDGSLVLGGHIEPKSMVRIAVPQGQSIMNYVDSSIRESIAQDSGFSPEVALVFSCASRKQVLGAFAKEEIEIAYKAVNCPLIGFFAYGEIGTSTREYGFHNITFVTLLLKEKGVL